MMVGGQWSPRLTRSSRWTLSGSVTRRLASLFISFATAAALVVVAPGSVPAARAATLQVGITGCNDGIGTPYCTITAAHAAANPDDTIEIIEDGTYNETVVITKNLSIVATNAGGVIIDAAEAGRVVQVQGPMTVTLSGLRLTGGSSPSGSGVFAGGGFVTIEDTEITGNTATGNGGAVFIGSGSLDLVRSSIHGNDAFRGGGIYNQSGALNVESSTISLNTSNQEGGAIYQQLGDSALQNATLTRNTASTGTFFIGGGNAALRNTVAAGNTTGSANPACNGGGSIVSLGSNFIARVGPVCASVFSAPGDITGTPADPADPLLLPLQDNGGVGLSHVPRSDSPLLDAGDNTGLDAATDQLGNARTVDGIADAVNTADIGAVELDPLTVCPVGCEYTFLDGVGGALPNLVDGSVVAIGTMTLTNEFIRIVDHADIVIQGRGMSQTIVSASSDADPLTPPDATFRVGHVQNIAFAPGASATIRDLTMMSGNQPAGAAGGGFSVFANSGFSSEATLERVRVTDNFAGTGGGLENSGQTLTVIDSIIDDNTANFASGGGIYVRGGGVTVLDGVSIAGNSAVSEGGGVVVALNAADLAITNSTISGNSAQRGGGLYDGVAGSNVRLNNVTVWDNSASVGASGIQSTSSTVDVDNTIIAVPAGPAVCAGLLDGDNNILSTDDGCTLTGANNQIGAGEAEIDPLLGPLADNGGPTPTHALLAGSPAVDAGNNATCELVDQRGVSRVSGAACDIGAFEVAAAFTLQELIDAAAPGGTILAGAGTFTENITIGDGKTLVGAGVGSTTVDGSTGGTTVVVTAGGATFEDLTIANGSDFADDGGNVRSLGNDVTLNNVVVQSGSAINGGNIFVDSATLTINDSFIVDGASSEAGAGVYVTDDAVITNTVFDSNNAFNSSGGGLYVGGGATVVTGGTFQGNVAEGSGGAAFVAADAALAIEDANACALAPDLGAFTPLTVFDTNTATSGLGGAIFNEGDLFVGKTLFASNSGAGGGAIAQQGNVADIFCSAFSGNTAGPGSAIYAPGSPLYVESTLFFANDGSGAINASGDVDVHLSKFDANVGGGMYLDLADSYVGVGNEFVNHSSQAVFAQTSGRFDSTNETYQNNTDNGALGAALFVQSPEGTIVGGTFTGNAGQTGGAIYNNFDLNIEASSFTANLATDDGGAIATTGLLNVVDSTFDGNFANGVGGAITSAIGEINIDGSTFTGNTAASGEVQAGGAVLFANGGFVINSTFNNNSTDGGGGAIGVILKPVEIHNSTIVGNTAVGFGPGVSAELAGLAQVANSIIADNSFGGGIESNCFNVGSLGYNVFGTVGCDAGPTDQQGGDPVEGQPTLDPVVGALQNNGGPTETMALLPGSPAIDNGDPGSGTVVTSAADTPQTNGSATTAGTEVLLTDGGSQAGSSFSSVPIDLGSSFVAEFQFQITPLNPLPPEDSGDGFTFAITDSPFALGDGAGRLGIGDPIGGPPVSYSAVSVEFDTLVNGLEPADHVGINVGTDIVDAFATDAIFSDVLAEVGANLDDGNVWTAWVDYDALLKRLEVRLAPDGVRPVAPLLTHEVDLLEEIPLTAYVGFTAGTGAAAAEHRIVDWQLTEASTCASLDQRDVPRIQGACDVGAFEVAANLAVALDLSSDPIVASGASTIATTDLPSDLAGQPTDPTDPTDDNIASAPVANLDTQSTELEASPIANLPVANLPIANLGAAAQAVVDAILLIDVTIEGGWEVHLQASSTLAGRPVQAVTLGEALADADVMASITAAGLTFDDMNVASTPIANLTIAGLALGEILLTEVPLDPTHTSPSQVLQGWCDFLNGQATDCAALGINPSTADANGYTVAGLSIAGADISAAPVANLPIANLPIANLPVANLPVANLVLVDSPIANLPVANLPIANLPIANLPVANLEVGGLPVANLPVANLPIANLPVANLPIANLEVDGAPIANLPVANLTTVAGLPIANLGPDGLPVANLPIANLPVANIPVANLSSLIDCSQPAVFDCDEPGVTVGEAFLAGVMIGTVSGWAGLLTIDDLIAIGVTNSAGDVLTIDDFVAAFVGVELIDLLASNGVTAELGSISLNELADYLGMTLGQLLQAMIDGGLGDDYFLGDLLLLLVNPEDYPWEDLDLDGVDLQDFDSGGGDTEFVAALNVAGGTNPAGQVTVQLPAGWLFAGVDVLGPGGVQELYTFTQSDGTVVVDVPDLADGTTTVEVAAKASLNIGVAAASATANVGGQIVNAGTIVQVAEVFEPNDTPETAQPAIEDTLYLTHIATEGDIDMYKIQNVAPGSRISVILSNMVEDFDLVLYEPELPPLRPGGVVPEGVATGVSDPGGYVDGDDQIQHEVTGDFPRAFFTAGPNAGELLNIYETSTQLGTSDEVITTATLQAQGDYYVQVHGSNGATSDTPYALRVEVIEPPSFLACDPGVMPFAGEGSVGGEFLPGAGPYNGLILWNQERFGDAYGATAAATLRESLQDLANENALGVNAVLVSVESVAAIRTAYADWDADRCNPLKANAVAALVGQLVDDYRALYPTIEYVTVVGDDGQIPFFRVPDRTEIANESDYALSVSQGNNELVGSMLAGFLLSDDPYGDAHPLLIDGRELYVSEVAMGRLVETPAQIEQAIDHFTAFGGRLDPSTASTGLSTGYDFIEDGATAIAEALDDDPRRTTSSLNTDTTVWSSQDLADEIDTLQPDVLSLGAHMAHDGLLSAAEDLAGTQADLYTPLDAQGQLSGVFENMIVFSMGCHSGLNVSAIQVQQPTADWPDTFNELGAVYVAETGYGYGETTMVAYGEELMRQFAARINGSMSAGQAMQFAKHFYAGNLPAFSPYDEKVLMETVFYGFPHYAVGDPTQPPPPPPVLPSVIDPATGLPVVTASFDYGVGAPGADGEFVLEQGGARGDFYTAEGEVQATPFNPIQPKASVDVTQAGLTGTGVFIEELSSQDIPNFDPVFSRPTVDLSANEPELSLPGTFPLALPGINTYLDLGGPRDQLVVVLGQFTDTDGEGELGVERLFTHVKANVLFGDPADVIVPTIERVRGLDNGTNLTFDVKAYDLVAGNGSLVPTDVARVYVLYKLVGANGDWLQLDLVQSGDRWVGSVASLGGQVEYIVQAVDFNGLVAVHSNKTAGNVSQDAPAPQPGGIDIVIGGNAPLPVYTDDPVVVDIEGVEDGDPVEVNVDGAGFEPYDGPFEVSGEGPHVVVVSNGVEEDSVSFIIDTQPPQVFITSPADGVIYPTGTTGVVADFSCSDAGTGVTACNATLNGSSIADGAAIDMSAVGTYTLAVQATDGAGHSSSDSITYEVADVPVLTVTPLLAALGESVSAVLDYTPGDHSHTVVFDWGDGTTTSCPADPECTLDDVNGSASASHAYAETGVFVIEATVTHDGGASQSVRSDFVVVYDPSAGFVTGGGSFESPFGAFTPRNSLDPEVTGPAEFGFVAKYQKGRSVPQGNTAFELVSSGFEFSSTSYEWLVVSGSAKAQFQGVGTIAGWSGEYNFKVTLRDADGNDGDSFTEDAFRIVIWQGEDIETGWLIYDNGFGQDENSESGGTTALDGGSIVIHVPKGGKKAR